MQIENLSNKQNYQPSPHTIKASSGTDSKPVEMTQVKKTPVKSVEKIEVDPKLSGEEKKVKSEKEVIKAIETANKNFKTIDRRLEFAIHESTKEIMVKVINTQDDSVIREIPSEKVLDMVAHMWEVAGILVDEKR